MKPIYLDHNATTPLLPEVWEAMRPYALEGCGNPASAHQLGRRARRGLEDAREQCAQLLGARADELIFTSGATEANNLAIFGLAGAAPGRILTSPLEHPSVSEPCRELARRGFELLSLEVQPSGLIDANKAGSALNPDARLIAIQLTNHETGAVQPVAALARLASGVPYHCDAAQAAGKLPLHFGELGVTTLSLSAHKFHGPVGVGALLVRRGTALRPRTWGGHQQRGLRPGTEPVVLAVGMAAALAAATRDFAQRDAHVRRLRGLFLDGLRAAAPPIVVNGPDGIPHTINVSFPGCQADLLLIALDLAGIACSTGSACSSGSLLPSATLKAMGVGSEILRSAMRFSLSPLLTENEIREAVKRIAEVVRRLRASEEEAPSNVARLTKAAEVSASLQPPRRP